MSLNTLHPMVLDTTGGFCFSKISAKLGFRKLTLSSSEFCSTSGIKEFLQLTALNCFTFLWLLFSFSSPTSDTLASLWLDRHSASKEGRDKDLSQRKDFFQKVNGRNKHRRVLDLSRPHHCSQGKQLPWCLVTHLKLPALHYHSF